jgi:hypothetical protein
MVGGERIFDREFRVPLAYVCLFKHPETGFLSVLEEEDRRSAKGSKYIYMAGA